MIRRSETFPVLVTDLDAALCAWCPSPEDAANAGVRSTSGSPWGGKWNGLFSGTSLTLYVWLFFGKKKKKKKIGIPRCYSGLF